MMATIFLEYCEKSPLQLVIHKSVLIGWSAESFDRARKHREGLFVVVYIMKRASTTLWWHGDSPSQELSKNVEIILQSHHMTLKIRPD
jgi:hypothetical protein